ncbi:MAG UNVERIFIED_CONTAM: hypothetical protein LVR18_24575 [Planctomycetaceae bacterium]
MAQDLNRRKILAGLAITAASGLLHSQASTRVHASPKIPDTPWKAGIARVCHHPDTPVWLAGYGSRRAPDGKLHDLWMKAIALEDPAGHQAVLITSDFQGVPRSMSNRVFADVQKKFGLERHQIMFTFSHNHCGPRLGDDLIDYYPVDADQEKLVSDYTDAMVIRTVELVAAALADLSPARLEQGEGKTTFAVNRRNNREADVPDLIARGVPLAEPVDHSVPVLRITALDGRLAPFSLDTPAIPPHSAL